MSELQRLGSVAVDELASLHADLRDPPAHDARPHVALNFVMTADGRVTRGGRAEIGTRTDRELMFHIRTLADAVLIGAGTLRVDPFAPKGAERPPLAVVLTRTCDLPLANRFFRGEGPRLVVTPRAAPQAAIAAVRATGAEVVTLGDEDVDPVALLRVLHERGVRFLLCEGGPRLAARLLHAAVVDEVFLTHATLVTAEPGARRLFESDRALPNEVRLERVSLHEGPAGELYERSRVRYSS